MQKSKWFWLALLLIPVLMIPSSMAQQKTLKIAFSVPGLKFPFFRITEAGAKAEAKKLGNVEILTQDGNDDDATQLALCENAVAQKVDGMVISPRTTEGLANCFKALQRANIPVVTFDRRAANAGDTLGHVGADNVKGGEQAAKFIVDRLKGKGNVIELLGTPGASPAIDRSKGFNNVISKESGIKVVAQQTANFNADKALSVMENILTSLGASKDKPGFDALFAANDDMALGAVQAIKARGIDPSKIVIVGFDALESALQLIEKGEMTGTVDQFPNTQAGMAVRIVVEKVRSNKEPSKDTFLTPDVISKANVNDASTRVK